MAALLARRVKVVVGVASMGVMVASSMTMSDREET